MSYTIAIVGATGLVGRTAIKIINEKGLINYTFYLFASSKSEGKKIKIGNKKLKILNLNDKILNLRPNFALFCTKEEISKKYVEALKGLGTTVIDCSSCYRREYPIIVPEINFKDHKQIIPNPNCSTATAVMCLHKIAKKFGLKRIVYSTYQAVSGAGNLAIKDLEQENETKLKKLDFPIKNNIIPYIGTIDENGYSTEENKMIYETKKILNLKDTEITATCIRVPVKNCHTISINFELETPATTQQIISVLKSSPNVRVLNDFNVYPMPIIADNQNEVFVGRIRKDLSHPNTFNIIAVADNLRKGAALNAVQILERLIKEGK